jgi:2-dehydropantoate 2-reductase
MLQDLEAGKALETDAIIGAVVEIARLTNVPAPTLRSVYAAIDLLGRKALPAQREAATRAAN